MGGFNIRPRIQQVAVICGSQCAQHAHIAVYNGVFPTDSTPAWKCSEIVVHVQNFKGKLQLCGFLSRVFQLVASYAIWRFLTYSRR